MMYRIVTLETAAASYDLITLAGIKQELNIPDTDTSKDDWLTQAISQVSGAIARHCNRTAAAANEASFPVETVLETIFPYRDPYPYQLPGGKDVLQLTHWPIVEVASVVITDPPGINTTLVEGTDFLTNQPDGQLIRLDTNMGYPTPWNPVKTAITYSGGYAVIPQDVVDATMRWMTMRWADRGRPGDLKSIEQPLVGTKVFNVGGTPMSGGVPEEIAHLLAPYRAAVMA